MPGQVLRNQMTGITAWKGTVTKDNQLYNVMNTQPQMASQIWTVLMSSMHLGTLNNYLETEVPTKSFEDDSSIFWNIVASERRNIPLVEARRADGTVVVAGSDNVGRDYEPFYLVFNENWFAKGEVLWGNLNEIYPMIVKEDEKLEGTRVVIKVEPFGAGMGDGIPAERLLSGERFSYGYAPIERSFSRSVGDVRFSLPIAMRSDFSCVRIHHKIGGKELGKRLCCNIPVSKEVNGKIVTQTVSRWIYNVTWQIEKTFEEYKNNALDRGVSTREENGKFSNLGLSGQPNEQGSGLRQLMSYGDQSYYSHFSLDLLENKLMSISAGKIPFNQRKFVIRTGEYGLRQFNREAKKTLSGWINMFGSRESNPANILKGPEKDYTNGNARTLVDEQYTRWISSNGLDVTLIVDSSKDDTVNNKIMHPMGGTAESYRYDIFYAGSEEEPNIQKCVVKDCPDRRGYRWGPFFNPFTGQSNNMNASYDEDAAEVDYKSTLGIIVRDFSRIISLLPECLQ